MLFLHLLAFFSLELPSALSGRRKDTVRCYMVQNPEVTFEPHFPIIVLLCAIDAGRLMQESVALDTSHESSRGTTRLPSPEVSADNEEFSDWDSWEGENEVQMLMLNCKILPTPSGFS